MYIYIYIYMYIYKHATMSGSQYPLAYYSSSFPFHCAGAHSARGFIRWVHPGVDPWRYQVAKCACSAGPDIGSLSSPISGTEKAQRGSRSWVSCKFAQKQKSALCTWEPAQGFACTE